MQRFSRNLPSSVTQISFRGEHLFLKRDDQIHPDFSGNKARKFSYFLSRDFPGVTRIVSYGSAQSNAMYSLSVLARMRGWEFVYYVDHVAPYLRDHPHGNYAAALSNGMRIIEGKTLRNISEDTLFVEEGGRQEEAEYGIRILAKEIVDWQVEQERERVHLFLPSGTGTTALYLQKSLKLLETSLKVYTVSCVGDGEYLRKQFAMLEPDEHCWPTILEPPRKYHFGKLYKEHYEIWIELQQQTGIEFDLLYDPIGWQTLLAHLAIFDAPVMYIHQGGIRGNESMIRRYERKYHDQNIKNQ